jgi:cell fate (sporulation/competence/biofilm development) regulator YlbF (YheA/YmcA/DUF963 family)
MSMAAADLDFSAVLGKAYDLADMIAESEVMREYKETKLALMNDSEAQQKIAEFQKLKEKYEEIQRFGLYHPDYRKVSKEIRVFKREMDLMPTVYAFKMAEIALDKLLYNISLLIAHSVSETIKVPSTNPFFQMESGESGCSTGGCNSCGNH